MRTDKNGKKIGNPGQHGNAEYFFLLNALVGEMKLIHSHLLSEANRQRDEYSKQLQDALLTKPRVSGTLGVNAEQLPGTPAEGAPQTSHAHAQGSRGDHAGI